ncbi:MAG: hypothetical protein ABL961_14400 [Vicinamibacterales bacterium]
MKDERRRRLDELVEREARDLLDQALLTGGPVPKARLDALVDLRTLADVQPHQPPPSRRWLPAVVMVLTLILMSALLFIRVPTTEIELEIQATGVTFRVPTLQALTEGTSLALLGVDGLRRIKVAGDRRHVEQVLVMEQANEGFVRLSSRKDGVRDGTITLAGITVPAMTRGSLRYAGVPNRFRLSLATADLDLRADVQGPVTAAVAGGKVEEMDFEVPEAVDLRGGQEMNLDLRFRDIEDGGFSSQVQVDDLSFIRIDERRDTERSVVRELSTVVSGTLYMESLNGEKRELRAAELLRFRGVDGDILAMRVMPDRVSLRFQGQVSDIVAGTPKSRRSLMPTLLEWARAQHGVSLLWGGSLYVFGIVVSVLRWLKVSV